MKSGSVRMSIAIVVCALALSEGTAFAENKVERTTAADPRGEVEIVNVSGTVHVSGWDRAEVKVTGTLESDSNRLELDRDGDRVRIEVEYSRRSRGGGDSDLMVYVPRDSSLVINTVSADQTIEGVRGAQRLQAVSGVIRTEVGLDDFQLETVSGDIFAKVLDTKSNGKDGSNTRATITSVSGDLWVSNINGEFRTNTVNGDQTIEARMLNRAHVRTTNGRVRLSGGLAREATLDAQSVNGDLIFNFDDPVNAEFDVETFNGRIDNCFGQTPKRKSEHGPGNELRFKAGEGSARARIKSMNGKVSVCGKKH